MADWPPLSIFTFKSLYQASFAPRIEGSCRLRLQPVLLPGFMGELSLTECCRRVVWQPFSGAQVSRCIECPEHPFNARYPLTTPTCA